MSQTLGHITCHQPARLMKARKRTLQLQPSPYLTLLPRPRRMRRNQANPHRDGPDLPICHSKLGTSLHLTRSYRQNDLRPSPQVPRILENHQRLLSIHISVLLRRKFHTLQGQELGSLRSNRDLPGALEACPRGSIISSQPMAKNTIPCNDGEALLYFAGAWEVLSSLRFQRMCLAT
jgi:hypothetical protein